MTAVAERTIDCFAKKTYEVPDVLHILGSKVEENVAELMVLASQLEAEAADFGRFSILSQPDGDKRVVWCRKVLAEIKAAKKMFMELIAKGMMPYKVGIDGKATAEQMSEFDPLAEEVIFMPVQAIRGG